MNDQTDSLTSSLPRTEIDIVRSEEAAGMVWLADGTRLRVRVMVGRVVRVEGQRNPDGTPVYEVATQLVINAKQKG